MRTEPMETNGFQRVGGFWPSPGGTRGGSLKVNRLQSHSRGTRTRGVGGFKYIHVSFYFSKLKETKKENVGDWCYLSQSIPAHSGGLLMNHTLSNHTDFAIRIGSAG